MMRVIFSLVMLAWCSSVCADSFQTVNDGPIHEAFVVQESGSLLLQPAPNAPPPMITELMPRQNDTSAIWIPGYWSWSHKHGVFLWVSGVWRRPPPQMQWVAGQWKNYPQGWVWISGFWTEAQPDSVAYLPMPPPDPIDQRVPTPPSSSENYFWVPGNWVFDSSLKQYVWYMGRWESIESQWVYCPAHYVWREKGYVFIPGFWDWPLQVRGEAFSTIYVDPEALAAFVYEPKHALDSLFVMEQLYPYWPNYSCLFQFHYLLYYNVWSTWGAAPPWWRWPAWNTFSRIDQWALWWWWSHPGYPTPTWITDALAQVIAPPPQFVVEMMHRIDPPPLVTPNGVVGEMALFQALVQVTGFNLPILPSDPKQVGQIQTIASPQKPTASVWEPKGNGHPMIPPPEKPFFGPSPQTLKAAPQRVILPPRPFVKDKESAEKAMPPKLPQRRVLTKQPIYSSPNQQGQPNARSYTPPTKVPKQGYTIDYTYPQAPMQTQHQNRIMGSPQPQINPAGPNVNPVPRDYSTLPGQ